MPLPVLNELAWNHLAITHDSGETPGGYRRLYAKILKQPVFIKVSPDTVYPRQGEAILHEWTESGWQPFIRLTGNDIIVQDETQGPPQMKPLEEVLDTLVAVYLAMRPHLII